MGNFCSKININIVILSEQYIKSNLDLWLCDLTFTRVYLLCRSKTCPKQVNKELKFIKWTQEWFDLDLWTCDLKINRDHLIIGRSSCTMFGIDQVKGSKDIERTTHGLQTDRPTVAKQYAPFFKRGIKRKSQMLNLKTTCM